ncbi:DUF4333 domain-containing protein, partial [Kibdelosporangium lantanae]
YNQGLRIEGYLAQAGYPTEVASAITRSPEVLEQSVNALCGSLIGFTEDGGPILGQVAESPSQNAERTAVQQGVVKILKDKYNEDATDVKCPADQEVKVGNKFECTLKVNGDARKVTITVKSEDKAEYEVSQSQ